MKSDLSELKSSISEMKNLSGAAFRLRNSMENLDRDDLDSENGDITKEPLVTFPDPDTPPPVTNTVTLCSPNLVNNITPNGLMTNGHIANLNANHVVSSASSSSSEVKFEEKRMTSASSTKVVHDRFSAEQAIANSAEMKRVQTSDMSYQEQSAASAMRARLEMEGVSAEKSIALKQVCRLV